jgi:hypothetical protein
MAKCVLGGGRRSRLSGPGRAKIADVSVAAALHYFFHAPGEKHGKPTFRGHQ